jgi:hypothetical protein
MPLFFDELKKENPELVGDKTKLDDVIYDTKIGELIDIIAFLLKGKTDEVKKCIKVMTRIEDPEELMKGTTTGGNFILKRYKIVKAEYDKIFEKAYDAAKKSKEKLFVYTYQEKEMSFSSNLSNRLIYLFPDKVLIIGREKSGEFKCSMRSKTAPVLPILTPLAAGMSSLPQRLSKRMLLRSSSEG